MLKRLVPLVVLVVTLLAFAGAFDNEFVNWDDEANFVANPYWCGFSAENVRWMLTTRLLGPYQPVSWLSLGLDCTLFGDGPTGPHVGNAVYHALAALMLFFVARRLLARALGLDVAGQACTLGAIAAALAFGVHPLRVESVAWATERRDVLSGFLLLATVLLYLRAVDRSGSEKRLAMGLALIVYTLSLGAKAIGMTLPAVLLVLDVWPLGRLREAGGLRTCLVEKLAFVVPAAIFAWIAVGGQADVDAMLTGEQMGPFDRMRLAAYGTVFYVGKTLWPATLWPHYQIPLDLDFSGLRYTLAVIATLVVTGAALALRRRAPWLLAGWVAYLVVLAPVSGLTIAGRQLAADRYSYLPGMVFALLAGGAIAWVERSALARARSAVRLAAVVALVALTVRTVQQTELWRDSRALWVHVLINEPDSVPGRNNLAQILAEEGDDETALLHYEAARRLAPAEPAIHLNLGIHYERLGRHGDAFAAVAKAAELDPDLWNARFFLGSRLDMLHRPEEAVGHLQRAAELNPTFAQGKMMLARVLVDLGRMDEAAVEVEQVLRWLELRRAPQYGSLAKTASQAGRDDLARQALEAGLAAHPGDQNLSQRLSDLPR
jgi:Flp pilus assembly protein TadD